MRDVAVVAYEQADMLREATHANDVELIMPLIDQALDKVKLTRRDIDFTCSGSCDYLGGAAFAFVGAVDALGAVPPIKESHVEMDAAWALYEAWLKIQTGEADIALVYGFGKSSHCEIRNLTSLQLDPYFMQPLWLDSISAAALQANALLQKGQYTEQDFADVVVDSRKKAQANSKAQLSGDTDAQTLLQEDMLVAPLRKHDCCPVSDGASVMIIAAKEKAQQLVKQPAWITGIDHRIDTHQLGMRDLTQCNSVKIAAEKAGVHKQPLDIAELYAPFSHQQLILKDAIGLSDDVNINPSGGPLAGHVFMACGLDRIGEVATRIMSGGANTGLAHATSGPCLQQNLVAVLSATTTNSTEA